jgi:hypothetical protein
VLLLCPTIQHFTFSQQEVYAKSADNLESRLHTPTYKTASASS